MCVQQGLSVCGVFFPLPSHRYEADSEGSFLPQRHDVQERWDCCHVTKSSQRLQCSEPEALLNIECSLATISSLRLDEKTISYGLQYVKACSIVSNRITKAISSVIWIRNSL